MRCGLDSGGDTAVQTDHSHGHTHGHSHSHSYSHTHGSELLSRAHAAAAAATAATRRPAPALQNVYNAYLDITIVNDAAQVARMVRQRGCAEGFAARR
jgi:hypothetical protein